MGVPEFLTDVLESALDQGIGTPSDVLRHATTDELSKHLPRPVWQQLITAALAASRTDARLVVDTVTIATICQHLPAPIVWACVAELGNRSLSRPTMPAGARASRDTGGPEVRGVREATADGGGRASTPTGGPEPRPPAPAGSGNHQAAGAGAGAGGKKPSPGKQRRRPVEDDDIEIDVADERKATDGGLGVDVDDEQLIDWAQSVEIAAESELAAAPAAGGSSDGRRDGDARRAPGSRG